MFYTNLPSSLRYKNCLDALPFPRFSKWREDAELFEQDKRPDNDVSGF